MDNNTNVNDKGGFGWGLLGCCIPLVGLILFLVWKDNKPNTAKAAGIGAIVGVVIGVVSYILMMVVGLGTYAALLQVYGKVFEDSFRVSCQAGSLVLLSGKAVSHLCAMHRRIGRNSSWNTFGTDVRNSAFFIGTADDGANDI